MSIDLLTRKQTNFVLWRAGANQLNPTIYIAKPSSNNPIEIEKFGEFTLHQSTEFPELWEVSPAECGLVDGQVYYYWFKVRNTDPYNPNNFNQILYCTDPISTTVDRRILAPIPSETGGVASYDPASIILYQNGILTPCDPQGQTVTWTWDTPVNSLPPNNRLVIYELPTRWAAIGEEGQTIVGIGTFQDVLSLMKTEASSPNFCNIHALAKDKAHLLELGINALELLPPADSDDKLEWGYGTANYFAADFDLGKPNSQDSPTASTDLANLIQVCHQYSIRFFVDMVMAFSRNNPYHNINFSDFYIQWRPKGDPKRDPEQGERDGFGGDLFKYNYWVEGYHLITGQKSWFVPSREYMKAYMAHWLAYYKVDGLRLDSVNNVGNYDFLQEFKDLAHQLWQKQGGSSDRFLVIGEELSVPMSLIYQNRLDGLWNEKFKQIIRQVILGKNAGGESSFEWSVRKLIDCRNLGFTDGSQAVNYLTSHDVGGFGNERFFNYLVNNGVVYTESRIKLAFVCLLTAVGIPMILAGDEFADQHDLDIRNEHGNHKQVDPVNYSRVTEEWRGRIFQYVARLVHFRTTSDALAVNDTKFIHVDFYGGKRVLVWQRGNNPDNLVVVVANFSDYGTPPGGEYKVHNFPPTPVGKQWKEITQNRIVPLSWVGREGIFPWEAKVYTLV
ncbi:MAG TPA: alpha amylase [Cyanobacteria bacterium UBA11149]|nr:alpha amylase [Cyanobacteria bacterium UBA11367]HBE58141.1 alpha amylase [Cyanobacteria bacterium UBA11366]HBK66630.1 alpha amylase [Cyanobacteria bacterium UBA11166]HBR72141.1 alpha amylase [Cyanobacteria bacterium UBA11159]HBS72654.1 alpha amylase [Cyanobacteria bacterium UBA11153]HBW89732.1 alpha amylase [Cyanobacteria bacterium UBA11149]HCA97903.1 alpha amylase [Cyanobacteria bacterium UBA9226]